MQRDRRIQNQERGSKYGDVNYYPVISGIWQATIRHIPRQTSISQGGRSKYRDEDLEPRERDQCKDKDQESRQWSSEYRVKDPKPRWRSGFEYRQRDMEV